MIFRQIRLVVRGPLQPPPDHSRLPRPVPTEETSMREFVRPVASALSIACLAASMAMMSAGAAFAQAKPAPAPAAQATPPQQPTVKQIALTEHQIEGVLAAQKDMDAIT